MLAYGRRRGVHFHLALKTTKEKDGDKNFFTTRPRHRRGLKSTKFTGKNQKPKTYHQGTNLCVNLYMKLCPSCAKEFDGKTSLCGECLDREKRRRLNGLSRRFVLIVLILGLIYANSQDMERVTGYFKKRSKRITADFRKIGNALKDIAEDLWHGFASRDNFSVEPGYLKGMGQRPRKIAPGSLGGGEIENFTKRVYNK